VNNDVSEKPDKDKPPRLVTIKINGVDKEIEFGNHTIVELKNLGNIPLADELDENKNGNLHPLHDDGHTHIEGGEIFLSQPRSGGSS
jgi:hypothetical protein